MDANDVERPAVKRKFSSQRLAALLKGGVLRIHAAWIQGELHLPGVTGHGRRCGGISSRADGKANPCRVVQETNADVAPRLPPSWPSSGLICWN